MKKLLSLILVGIMMLSSISVFATEKAVASDNIIGGTPVAFETEASELVSLGILKGDPDGNLRLDDVITRAEATALITRMNANYNDILKDYIYRPTFDDVENHWAAKEITFAHENALVGGISETTFEPDKNVTAQEFLKMIVCLLGYKEAAEKKAPDYIGYILQASQSGITKDVPLITDKPLTRRQAVKIICNSLDVPLMKQSGFGANTEYIVMDGKNGVPLETFRTIWEAK